MNKEIKVPLDVTIIYDRERVEKVGMGYIIVADSNSNKDIAKKSSYFLSPNDKLSKLKLNNTGFSIKLDKNSTKEFEYYGGGTVVLLKLDHPDFDEDFKENNENLRIKIFLEDYLRILKTTSSINGNIEETFSLALIKGFPDIYELVCENQAENLQVYLGKSKLLKESKKTSKWIFGHKYLLEDNKEYLYLGKVHLFSDTNNNRYRITNICYPLHYYTNFSKSGNLLLELTGELKLLLQTTDSDFSVVLEKIYEKFDKYTIPIKFRKTLPSGVDLGEIITNNLNVSFNDIRNKILISKIDNSIKGSEELLELADFIDILFVISDTGTLNFPKDVSDKIMQLYEDLIICQQKNFSLSTPIGNILSYCRINYTGTMNYFKDVFSIDIVKRAQDILEKIRNPKP